MTMFQVLVTISTAQKVFENPLEENPGVKVVEVIFLDDELDQLVAHDEGEDDASDGDNHRFREVSDHVEDAAVQAAGVMPTSPAISPTFVFRESNIPVRFEMIPSMSSSLNHSWIISNIKGDHLLCGGSRYQAKAPAGFGESLGGGQQTGQQRDQGDADEGNAAARHELLDALAFGAGLSWP